MLVGWLEKAEIKPTQPSWSLSWAELGNKDYFQPHSSTNAVSLTMRQLHRVVMLNTKELFMRG